MPPPLTGGDATDDEETDEETADDGFAWRPRRLFGSSTTPPPTRVYRYGVLADLLGATVGDLRCALEPPIEPPVLVETPEPGGAAAAGRRRDGGTPRRRSRGSSRRRAAGRRAKGRKTGRSPSSKAPRPASGRVAIFGVWRMKGDLLSLSYCAHGAAVSASWPTTRVHTRRRGRFLH